MGSKGSMAADMWALGATLFILWVFLSCVLSGGDRFLYLPTCCHYISIFHSLVGVAPFTDPRGQQYEFERILKGQYCSDVDGWSQLSSNAKVRLGWSCLHYCLCFEEMCRNPISYLCSGFDPESVASGLPKTLDSSASPQPPMAEGKPLLVNIMKYSYFQHFLSPCTTSPPPRVGEPARSTWNNHRRGWENFYIQWNSLFLSIW